MPTPAAPPSFFFFFQAEDGIRDHCVTGVETCALPIWSSVRSVTDDHPQPLRADVRDEVLVGTEGDPVGRHERSEERRVGKECRSGWARYKRKKKEEIDGGSGECTMRCRDTLERS